PPAQTPPPRVLSADLGRCDRGHCAADRTAGTDSAAADGARPSARRPHPVRRRTRRCDDHRQGRSDLPGRTAHERRQIDLRTSLGRGDAGTDRRVPRHRVRGRSEEHTSELQSRFDIVCRLLLEKKKKIGKKMLLLNVSANGGILVKKMRVVVRYHCLIVYNYKKADIKMLTHRILVSDMVNCGRI